MNRFFLLVLSFLLLPTLGQVPGQAQQPAKKITEGEIKSFINSGFGGGSEDVCESLDQIYLSHLEYYDFTGDSQPQAIVVASTCMTGTAGPDVHVVYKRGADGKLVELPFLNAKGDPPAPEISAHSASSNAPVNNGEGVEIPLFGNRNYTLTVENGMLVAHFGDTSDREEPVVIWYKWDGAKFVVDHKKVQGPFPTSYDCAKATKEMDRAICYSPSVAALDVQLGQVYKAALKKLPAEKKQLQTQQREWLINREKQCTIYKWWVECLQESYTKRLAELKQR